MTSSNEPTAPPAPDPPPSWAPLERLATWMMRGPLTAAVVGYCLVLLASWIPLYLNWPWWVDLDVFATMAQAWDAGIRPYRDLSAFNFPGQIYLFWILGKTFGWGRTMPIYAVDAGLVVALGAVMLTWSRRRFGRVLPGAIGYASFLVYYLDLDFALVAERDWHSSFLAVTGLLVLQAWPGRAGRLLSALTTALAMTVRPFAVLFLPAMASAIDEGARRPEEPWGRAARAELGWALLFAAFVALGFAPLGLAGLLDDFVRDVAVARYGGAYSKRTVTDIVHTIVRQFGYFKYVTILVASAVLANRSGPVMRRTARTWLVAQLAMFLYMPLAPVSWEYLRQPAELVFSVNLSVVIALVLEVRRLDDELRLVGTLLALAVAVPHWPHNAVGWDNGKSVKRSIEAIRLLARGQVSAEVASSQWSQYRGSPYPWEDYSRALDHLRRTTPRTRVASLLWGAVNGPVGRLPVFPIPTAGGLIWLAMHRPGDEEAFVRALERTPDSVVVWVPEYQDSYPQLAGAVRRLYEFEARFGKIEVWRRKRGAAGPPPASPAAQSPRAGQGPGRLG